MDKLKERLKGEAHLYFGNKEKNIAFYLDRFIHRRDN